MSFTLSHGFYPLAVRDMEYDHATGELYTATELGVWRYRSSWSPASAGIIGVAYNSIVDVAMSPGFGSDHTLFAAWNSGVSIGGAIYRSTNSGLTWDRRIGAAYVSKIVLSPAFLSDRRAYAVADDRILESVDGGSTWGPQPYWTSARSARLLAISPDFATDQRLLAVGDAVYLSTDAGVSWRAASAPPPITTDATIPWFPNRLIAASANVYYLSLYRFEPDPPYNRHDQLWLSEDGGDTWAAAPSAPDVPITAIAVSPNFAATPNLYLSSADDNSLDDQDFEPDLFHSPDGGRVWRNLGALPDRASPFSLLVPRGPSPETVFIGAEGVWQSVLADAPTATPDPCTTLLDNRSFEYEGDWRIPVTSYPARRVTDKHYHGWWSMQTGIADPAANRRGYSDFSQDVVLPVGRKLSLEFWRWPQASTVATARAPDLSAVLSARTLDEFHRVLTTQENDLQYGMVISPPVNGVITFLYARLDDDRAWINETFDLNAFAGKHVRLQFGAFNNGSGPVTVQYFDAFNLQSCAATTPTVTPTPPPTTPQYNWWPFHPLGFPSLPPTPTITPTPTPTVTPTLTPTATPTLTPTPPFTFSDVYPNYALAHGVSPEFLYVLDTSGRLLRSTDQGDSWTDLNIAGEAASARLRPGRQPDPTLARVHQRRQRSALQR